MNDNNIDKISIFKKRITECLRDARRRISGPTPCSSALCILIHFYHKTGQSQRLRLVSTDGFGQLFVFALDPSNDVSADERPKLSDPAHEGARLQPGCDGRVRCSAWLSGM